MGARTHRVMIAGGGPGDRNLLAEAFRQQHLDVSDVPQWPDAREVMLEIRPAVVVLDWPIAGGGAADIQRLCRQMPEPPIVLVQLPGGEPVPEEFDPRFIQGVFRKPADLQELAQIVRACVEMQGGRSLATMCAALIVTALLLH